ncbi:hypothetical protein J3E68DRAFT_396984 [Trichoderma sp. SZMC 28012]
MTCLELGRWFSKNEWRLLVFTFLFPARCSIFLFGVFAQCYSVSTCTVQFPGPPISGKSGRPRQPELGIWISPFGQFKTPTLISRSTSTPTSPSSYSMLYRDIPCRQTLL